MLNNELCVSLSRWSYVLNLIRLAKQAGCHGIVCSAIDVEDIVNKGYEKALEDMIVICPGVRFLEDSNDDQKNVITPQKALEHPSIDYIVMGRSLLSRLNQFNK